MATGPAWDDEDEPTVIKPSPAEGAAPVATVARMLRRGALWGVAGVLPPLGFLLLAALSRPRGDGAPPPPEWVGTVLLAAAVVGPVAGLLGGGVALSNGLGAHRAMKAAGVKHHAPAGISLGASALLFGIAALAVALWMLWRAAASLG